MTDPGSSKTSPDKTGAAGPRAAAREERLAAALKANLRRRKAQARERALGTDLPDTGLPGSGLATDHEAGPPGRR